VSFLDSCGADLRTKNGLGCTPIWIAAGYDHLNCLKYLIEKIMADDNNSLEQCLLDANDTGDTPVLAACSKGNIDICKYLLESMDNLDTKRKLLRTANKAGDTALKVAVAGGQDINLLRLLLDADLSIHQSELANSEEMCINRKNNLGLSPLIIASERNLPDVVQLLIQYNADVRICDDKGRHALAVASFCGCEDVVKFLLSRIKESPSVASLLNETDNKGCSSIWLAARTGSLSMVKLLIESGADETIADDEGVTPMEVASKFKKEKVFKYLQERQ